MAKIRINKEMNSEGRAIGHHFLAVPEEWRTPKVSFAAVSIMAPLRRFRQFSMHTKLRNSALRWSLA
ncbi:MAG: hypothetical protein LBD07_02450 [Spirochaetaceae bacterium]|nr:hypothetical protein [Spirochaetaceae bacterium]